MTGWMADAACRDTDTEMFFPNYTLKEAVRPAITICKTCPVAAECLSYARSTGATHGIWGGIVINSSSNSLSQEEEQELLEGVKAGLDAGWTIEQTAKHMRINLQRAKKYQRIIEAARREEQQWDGQQESIFVRMRRMLPF